MLQFLGVDRLTVLSPDGSIEILERVEGGEHQASILAGPPAVLGWATGYLPEPRNNPQVGMINMRLVMPAFSGPSPPPYRAPACTTNRCRSPLSGAKRGS